MRHYEGKLLNTNVDDSPDLGATIADSPAFKRVLEKMPVTPRR